MRIIGIIPARYGSSRFPGKPLAPIRGKPMIAWVVDAALASRALQQVIVATDDDRIAHAAAQAGAEAVMTGSHFAAGTDRVAWVARGRKPDVVVNIQGDEPLLPPSAIADLVAPFADPHVVMATLASPFTSWDEVENPRTAKIVVDQSGDALYFSRAPIPFHYHSRRAESAHGGEEVPGPAFIRHIGIYAYRAEILQRLAITPPVAIEKIERLEQLRALHLGIRIRVVRIAHGTIGVDTPEDLANVERILSGRMAPAE